MIRFVCTGCGKKLGTADTEAGKAVKCPACGTKVRVPAAGDSAAPAPPAPKSSPKPAPKPAPAPKSAPPPKSVPPRKPPPHEVEKKEAGARGEQEFVDVEPDEGPPPRRKSGLTASRPAPRRPRPEDQDEDLEEAEERPRGRRRARQGEEDIEDEEEFDGEEKTGLTPNRIRGILGVVLGGVVIALALLFETIKPGLEGGELAYNTIRVVGCGIGGVLLVAGSYFLIRG